jgi:copper chaperone CopZ
MNARKYVAFSLVVALTWCSYVSAAEKSTKTLITVKELHCKGCAKKIAGQLYTVAGVKEVAVNMERKLFVITPQEKKLPLSRAMWEAVVKGEGRPIRLVGPQGTFEKKPRSSPPKEPRH